MPARAQSIAPLRKTVVRFAAGNGAAAVDAWMHERSLEVVACDEGSGMLPRTDSPGMGTGLTLIDRIAEQFRLEAMRPGVRAQMTFAIGAR